MAAGVGSLTVLGARGQSAVPAKKPLRVALIGCGGQGVGTLLPECCKERVVALVDPDRRRIEAAFAQIRRVAPSVDTAAIKTFDDYRKLFDQMGKELDAVVIATPNHQHALPALMAIRHGLHVYLEKPLAHTFAESQLLRDEARRCGVATQMGQDGHSSEGCRHLGEYIGAGASCRGGAPACANFEYSAPLAQIPLLGNIAMLAGLKRRVEWDAAALRCTNRPELNRFLKTTYREGWRI